MTSHFCQSLKEAHSTKMSDKIVLNLDQANRIQLPVVLDYFFHLNIFLNI